MTNFHHSSTECTNEKEEIEHYPAQIRASTRLHHKQKCASSVLRVAAIGTTSLHIHLGGPIRQARKACKCSASL